MQFHHRYPLHRKRYEVSTSSFKAALALISSGRMLQVSSFKNHSHQADGLRCQVNVGTGASFLPSLLLTQEITPLAATLRTFTNSNLSLSRCSELFCACITYYAVFRSHRLPQLTSGHWSDKRWDLPDLLEDFPQSLTIAIRSTIFSPLCS